MSCAKTMFFEAMHAEAVFFKIVHAETMLAIFYKVIYVELMQEGGGVSVAITVFIGAISVAIKS